MKVIVSGSRNGVLSEDDLAFLDSAGITELVYGCCTGIDTLARAWAVGKGIPTKPFPANWTRYGNAAGPIRNKQMADYADAVILFPGDRGTESMRREAVKAGIKIIDKR